MVEISRKTYWKNIEKELGHKNLHKIKTKYYSRHRKYRYDLVEEPKKDFHTRKISSKIIHGLEDNSYTYV